MSMVAASESTAERDADGVLERSSGSVRYGAAAIAALANRVLLVASFTLDTHGRFADQPPEAAVVRVAQMDRHHDMAFDMRQAGVAMEKPRTLANSCRRGNSARPPRLMG
jgi:hypothetical protein